ncbi:MAG: hypothetical protein LBK99_20965 [Opitutaceae bacterium]|jgi:hypothetical protein|nr:hypothetical protein [Opitutaceae bacterium]
METGKMREKKKNANLAFVPALRIAAEKWGNAHGVSLSVIASAAFAILTRTPLTDKELVVENGLRKALGAPPSTSESQLERRIAALEAWQATQESSDVDGPRA